MKVTNFNYLALLGYFPALSLADPVQFGVNICPWYYLRQNVIGPSPDYEVELVALCDAGTVSAHDYRASRLNLDACYTNTDGILEAITPQTEKPGPFSKTCYNCGISVTGSSTDPNMWKAILMCDCKFKGVDTMHQGSTTTLDATLTVENGVLGCLGKQGEVISDPAKFAPAVIPPQVTITTASVSTAVSTVNNTITLTSTETATVNSTVTLTSVSTGTDTFFSTATATATAVSTAAASCPSASPATTTKVRKVTKTKQVTVTSAVMSTVSPPTVTVTVTPTGSVFASLFTTVQATFATEYTTQG